MQLAAFLQKECYNAKQRSNSQISSQGQNIFCPGYHEIAVKSERERKKEMKKGKKILSILLAASVGVTGLIGSSTVYGAQKTETKQKYVVVLDPGHGGNESGAYAVHNGKVYREEEINWKIANYTMQALSQASDIEVHLTKTKKQTVSLMKRVTTAKNYGADLLVSQHINDSDSSYSRGACVLVS